MDATTTMPIYDAATSRTVFKAKDYYEYKNYILWGEVHYETSPDYRCKFFNLDYYEPGIAELISRTTTVREATDPEPTSYYLFITVPQKHYEHYVTTKGLLPTRNPVHYDNMPFHYLPNYAMAFGIYYEYFKGKLGDPDYTDSLNYVTIGLNYKADEEPKPTTAFNRHYIDYCHSHYSTDYIHLYDDSTNTTKTVLPLQTTFENHVAFGYKYENVNEKENYFQRYYHNPDYQTIYSLRFKRGDNPTWINYNSQEAMEDHENYEEPKRRCTVS